MRRFALKYIVLRTISTVIGLIIIIANFIIWNVSPDEIATLDPILLYRAVLFGLQAFMFSWLAFLTADSISRFWWNRWRLSETSAVETQEITISTGKGNQISGILYQPVNDRDNPTPKKMIIVSYGFNDNLFRAQHIARSLAAAGFTALTWDYRGRGKTRGRITDLEGHLDDLRSLITHWSKEAITQHAQLYLCGWSMGGMLSINAGLGDDRVSRIFTWSTWSDLRRRVLWRLYINPFTLLRYLFKGELLYVSRQRNLKVSPVHYALRIAQDCGGQQNLQALVNEKLFMCHARNDTLVGYDNFKENVRAFSLPPSNQFIFKKGSHLLVRKESILIGLMYRFFNGGER
nr:alpha/beta fold hydrolase [Candidatus Sigynarchaeota archaeon]